jgi:hypothetical protein
MTRAFDREVFLDLLGRYFEALSLSTDWDSLKDAEDELLINYVVDAVPVRPRGKAGASGGSVAGHAA